MMDLNDRRVCRECGAYSGGRGWCANLPGHPFEGVTLEEYVALHPEDGGAATYLQSRHKEAQRSAGWKRVLGEPGTARHVPRPDADRESGLDAKDLDHGGGPSFDRVYTTALLDWRLESRNVGRHDGHMANLVVTRNGTGLPWADGWSKEDEALDALMSVAMADLDKECDKERNRQLTAARTPASPIPFDPFSE